MKRRFNMYRKMIMTGVVMLMGLSLSSVWAYVPLTPLSGGGTTNTNPADYRFQSTSPLLDNSPSVQDSKSPVTYGTNYGPVREGWDDDGNEIGVVDDFVPVGEPCILLLMAAAYSLFCLRKRKDRA